jgi:HEAT repeat protein
MVRSGAALALGELQAETAVSTLAHLLTTDISACGDHAADALAKIGPAAAPALLEALRQDAAWVRRRAAKSLVPVESTTAIPALFEALDDESYLVRQYAEEALKRMGVGDMVFFRP